MLQAVEAIINPDGSVRLLEHVEVLRPTKVILTLLNNDEDGYTQSPEKGDAASILSWLESSHYISRPPGNSDEIEKTIQENRDAWSDR